ncbi:hypothetical protein TEK04_19555 [Klenkia sp. LSe6-5]|uniref:Uncharacterized protein n=1 Tax=Klenkia sesuvii TaxID=3103137 RepID=A0ABU8DZ09_9ACTN
MARLAWPRIVTQHVLELPKLTAWTAASARAFDGPAITGDILTSWVTVGYVPGEETGATWTQTPDGEVDGLTREDGTIACQLVCSGSGDDVVEVRQRLADLLDDWQDWLLADNTQGGALLGHSRLQLSADVGLLLNDRGASATALIALEYTAVAVP